MHLNFLVGFIFCAATISFASDSSGNSREDCSQDEVPHGEIIPGFQLFKKQSEFCVSDLSDKARNSLLNFYRAFPGNETLAQELEELGEAIINVAAPRDNQ